jgi:hypothetical protein
MKGSRIIGFVELRTGVVGDGFGDIAFSSTS